MAADFHGPTWRTRIPLTSPDHVTGAPLTVLVETARLSGGGSVQVALEQYRYLENDQRLRCTWRLSHRLAQEIEAAGLSMPARWQVAESGFVRQARQLRRMLRETRPDLVYTVFGPAHLPVGSIPHVCGFAYGWMMWPDNLAARRLPRRERLRQRAGDVGRHIMLRNADHYIVETDLARTWLLDATGLSPECIRVASNTCADVFRTWDGSAPPDPRFERRSTDEILLFVLSGHYLHKNLEIVPAVAEALKRQTSRPFRFLLTLDTDSVGWRLISSDARERRVAENVGTVGSLKLMECPGAYAACDALFLPTLLETFTASYPEAMQMRRPIVTPDLSFARDICQDAALYYSALDAGAAAQAIVRLFDDDELRDGLVTAGQARLADFMDSSERANAVVDLLQYAAGRSKS